MLAADGLSEQQLTDRIAPVAAASDVPAEAVTGDQVRDEATESILTILGFITTFLLVFAGISLFVGAFIIANTFSMWVRQRTRELALLRAVGASPLQVFTSIVAAGGDRRRRRRGARRRGRARARRGSALGAGHGSGCS